LRRLHRRLTWIALFAVLVGALVPTLSRALAVGGNGGWTEVCTALGAKWVPLVEDAASQPAPAPLRPHGVLDHCAYCSLPGTQAALLPPAAPLPIAACMVDDRPPDRCLDAPRTLHAWCRAQPRAPPGAA
jgi:hypothetical protein